MLPKISLAIAVSMLLFVLAPTVAANPQGPSPPPEASCPIGYNEDAILNACITTMPTCGPCPSMPGVQAICVVADVICVPYLVFCLSCHNATTPYGAWVELCNIPQTDCTCYAELGTVQACTFIIR